jgi:hypothetical protein
MINEHNDDDEKWTPPESAFDEDKGGPLPFKVDARLELRFLMPAGADLTCIGEGDGGTKATDWIVDVPPLEVERVAELFEGMAQHLRHIKARRDLEL